MMQSDQIKVVSLLAYFFYTQGYHARAIHLYSALDVMDAQDPSHLRGLALSYAAAQQYALALAALDRLALRGAVDAAFYLLRSQVLSALGRPEESANAMSAFTDLRLRESPAEP